MPEQSAESVVSPRISVETRRGVAVTVGESLLDDAIVSQHRIIAR